jgi:hypothetical protein
MQGVGRAQPEVFGVVDFSTAKAWAENVINAMSARGVVGNCIVDEIW